MKHLIATALFALTLVAWAQTPVKVEDAWVRGTVAQQTATGAFMRLTAAQNTRLVGASSPVAGVVEVHEMAMDKDVMRMRAVPVLELAAGRTVELKPGGLHVMLMDLKRPLQVGEAVPLTLVFEDGARQRFSQEVRVSVTPLGTAKAPAPHDHGAMSGGHKH